MSIAKSTDIQPTLTAPVLPSAPIPSVSSFEWQGVPIDVFRTFNTEMSTVPAKDIQQLKDITDWAKSKVGNEGTIGDILSKISEIRQKVGQPIINGKSYSKVWEYVKLQKIADEALKRQQSLNAPRVI